MAHELDDVDRGILYMLQLDARNTTSQDIAETVGVSASTIRNRIERMESEGVIESYHPTIDYEAANLPLRVVLVATADPAIRSAVVERLLDIQGVVDIREMVTGSRNIDVEVVGRDTSDIVRIIDAIHDLDVTVERSELVKQRRRQPFDHFYLSSESVERDRSDATSGE